MRAREQLIGKYFVGTVKQVTDSSGLRRVKVMVPELFQDPITNKDLATADLPWLTVASPVFRGNGGGTGFFSKPRLGSKVLCVFDLGDVYSGIVLAEIVTGADQIAFDDAEWGFVDENGTAIKVNTSTKLLTITHQGTTVTIDTDGKVLVTAAADTTVNVTGTARITATVKAVVSSPLVELSNSTGAALKKLMTEDMVALFNGFATAFNAHTHLYLPGPGSAAPTGVPGASTPPETFSSTTVSATCTSKTTAG